MALGSDHPRGSFCASEQMEQERIAKSARHGWLVLGTNTMFDVGFVIAAFVPLLLYWIHGEAHLSTIWGLSLFLGAVPGFFHVFYSAIEPPHCCDANRSVKAAYVPLWLSLKWNWRSFLGLSVAWWVVMTCRYPLGIYASAIINDVTGGNSPLSIVFGWTMVINLLYIPGTMAGVFLIDSVSPRTVMVIGSLLQAAVGFIVAALLSPLTSHVAVIAVAYGTFLSLGEVGPGNCLIVLAAKTGPTATRGQICDLAFGIGKVGAFIGIWVIPRIIDTFGGLKSAKGITGPFWIGGALAALSALVTILLVKPLAQDGARAEDEAFHQYLKDNGFDASHLGVPDNESSAA
ncbi:major facilitator superfamily domain-containing protein [Pisolithus marmoratus]|nr:major facilitator superfamily domain-containing protein [Pisolithus marmoratus]